MPEYFMPAYTLDHLGTKRTMTLETARRRTAVTSEASEPVAAEIPSIRVLGQHVVGTGVYIVQDGTKVPAARYIRSIYF
jgi:hypothetical protein